MDETLDPAQLAAAGVDKLMHDSEYHAKLLREALNIGTALLISRVLVPRQLIKLSVALQEAGFRVPVLTHDQARAIWRPAMILVGALAYRLEKSPRRATLEEARRMLGLPETLRRVK
jgi:hypothetical protein